jgi:hypothetical protein
LPNQHEAEFKPHTTKKKKKSRYYFIVNREALILSEEEDFATLDGLLRFLNLNYE